MESEIGEELIKSTGPPTIGWCLPTLDLMCSRFHLSYASSFISSQLHANGHCDNIISSSSFCLAKRERERDKEILVY